MSEELLNNQELAHTPETKDRAREKTEAESNNEKMDVAPEKQPNIDQIRDSIMHEARTGEEERPKVESKQSTYSPNEISKDFKLQALNRLLNRVRQQLSPPERGLSHIIHQPVVDSISELGSKTIGRPSGILGGGICAFIGSLLFLYFSKHVGFHYNYIAFFVFFVGGFIFGLVLETTLWLIHRLKQGS